MKSEKEIRDVLNKCKAIPNSDIAYTSCPLLDLTYGICCDCSLETVLEWVLEEANNESGD